MRRQRFAKIVATLGLTSSDSAVIEHLFLAGVDVFRLNFSHGTHEQHAINIKTIREIEAKHQRPIAILQDLQGPKFRVGQFVDKQVALTSGQSFVFDCDPTPGDASRVYLPHPEIFSGAKPGDRLLVDDARVCFKVTAVTPERIDCLHVYGKAISNNKGINLPDTVLSVSVLTDKDITDLQFGLSQGVDYVALSFVQRASDMYRLREMVGDRANILAKIEKPSAVDDIEAILEASDAIMLARGDLGVEFPPEELPSIQKTIVQKAREVGKPIVIATQMLESMIDSPVPTRAEATDIDTAISSGADAVMLSGETAIGKYPIEAVSFMNRMIIQTEKDWRYRSDMKHAAFGHVTTSEGAISLAVKAIANAMPIVAVACYTTSGRSAIRLGRERALTPLIALTPSQDTARRLQLHWGIDACLMPDVDRFQTIVAAATETVRKKGYGSQGSPVIVTAGVPFGQSGTTNTLRLAIIGADDSAQIIA
ncbi:pyruvate kinase [Ostreibacterium oceani]|uniref:Pyruvate kinase n=1 Tax=Ostreibacterium oceani TaxID=2654998 RepID=A0A6N7EXH7_9GAMM|nr:pyruvate kinase [Ostreibacterium oceani]MPV86295.1 pyruvate kinase [Ostreibacterium oceani]